MKQLTPIEKYALNYLELFHASIDHEKERNGEVRAILTHEWLRFCGLEFGLEESELPGVTGTTPNPPVQTPVAMQVREARASSSTCGQLWCLTCWAQRSAGQWATTAWGARDREESETSWGAGVFPVGTLDAESKPVLSQQDAVLAAMSAWEAQNLRTLQEQEARAQQEQEQEQEQLLTYTREDAYNAVRTHRRITTRTCALGCVVS